MSKQIITDLEIPVIRVGQIYKHYKGSCYEVMAFATHSETNEPVVIYRRADMSEPRLWCRPQSMWFETVNVDGKTKFRFTLATIPEMESLNAEVNH